LIDHPFRKGLAEAETTVSASLFLRKDLEKRLVNPDGLGAHDSSMWGLDWKSGNSFLAAAL